MKPLLYPATARTFGTFSEGEQTYAGYIGVLTDALSCTVEEERNGMFECTLEYPVSGALFNELKIGRIIFVPHDVTMKPQPFDIYAMEITTDGKATYRARHISYRLSKLICKPTKAEVHEGVIGYNTLGGWLNYAMGYIVQTSGMYNQHINKLPHGVEFIPELKGFNTIPKFKNKHTWGELKSARDELLGTEGSILDWFGGEYQWDGFNVYLCKRRGTDTPIVIRYGQNLVGMTYEFDASEAVDGVAPYWMDSVSIEIDTGETDSDTGNPIKATESVGVARYFNGSAVFEDVSSHPFPADIAVAPYNEDYCIGDAFTALPVEVNIDTDVDGAAALPNMFDRLYDAGDKDYHDNHQGSSYERLTVDFTQLSSSAEYKEFAGAETLVLCDTVTFYYPEIGLNRRLKLTKTTFDVLTERYTQLEFGATARNLYNTDSTAGTEPIEADTPINTDDTSIDDDEPIVVDDGEEPVEVIEE